MKPRKTMDRLLPWRWQAILYLPFTILICFAAASPAGAERVKDLASIDGVRNNQLVGYGLVVGLDGTGDRTTQAKFTIQGLRNLLERMGITIPPGTNLQLNNVASVMVHTDLPPFVKPGQTLDITVSSMANASSLRGGTLLMTPLKGVDGQVYAMAQGNLISGGVSASGNDGSSVTIGVPSVARIPNGATVERSVPMAFADNGLMTFNLHRPDFTTATRLATEFNSAVGEGSARAIDAASVQVLAPIDPGQQTMFVSMLENLEIQPDQLAARVIVNSRTGTVVISNHVRVSPAAVSHGTLVVSITEDFDVSQPSAFSGRSRARTVVTQDSQVDLIRPDNHMFLFQPGVELDEIVQAVNEVGASPGDLIAILEALREAGALRAELIVI